jgi:hypothetical protein
VIYNNPELYWHEFSPLEIKRNQREACNLIRQSIHEAIRKMLPIKLVLKEYLSNDYMDDDNDVTNRISNSEYMNIHAMVNRDLHGIPVPGRENIPVQNALESSDDDDDEDEEVEKQTKKEREEDYTASSSSSSEEDYLTGDNTDNTDKDTELQKMKEALQKVISSPKEKEKEKEEQGPTLPQSGGDNDNNSDTEQKLISQISGVPPKADNDEEIKKLLENSHMVKNVEMKSKNKLSKKEENLLNEIEANLRSKQDEPNRKIFFEQYMK